MEKPLILNSNNVEDYFDKTALPAMPSGTEVVCINEVTENTFVNWVFAMHLRVGDSGQSETVYVRQSRDYVKEYKDLARDPRRVETEARALGFINGVAPGAVPEVINLDKDNSILILSDIRLGGALLADEFTEGRVHEEVGANFGRTIAEIQNASLYLSFGQILGDESIKESDDKNAYLGSRVEAPMRLFPEQTTDLLRQSSDSQRSFVVGDLSPKNIFVEGNDARFLDLERTSTGDPAYDPAYIVTHFLIDVDHKLHSKSLEFIKKFMQSYTKVISEKLSQDEINGLQNRIVRFIGFSILHRTQGSHFVSYTGEDKDLWQQRAGLLLEDTSSISVFDAISSLLK
jgi:tRNA A-37 threonylcarbamoyl transferase component Bud32